MPKFNFPRRDPAQVLSFIRVILFLVPGLGVCVIISAFLPRSQKDIDLYQNQATTIGVVSNVITESRWVSVSSRSDPTNTGYNEYSYYEQVKYTVAGTDYFLNHLETTLDTKVGDTPTVYYNKQNPQEASLVAPLSPEAYLQSQIFRILFGLFILVLGIALLTTVSRAFSSNKSKKDFFNFQSRW